MSFDPNSLTDIQRQTLKENIADLQAKHALFVKKETLHVGDFVTWKPGLTNRRYPRAGTCGIVTRVFPVPVKDPAKAEAGSPYFNEELTVSVGVIDIDGDFVEFTYDGHRLQRVEASSMPPIQSGFICDECRAKDFTGLRFHCAVCDDFDLCAKCHSAHATPGGHKADHKMLMIEPSSPDVLAERFQSFMAVECFQPGDLVQWKAGLKNKRLPKADQLGVVVDMLPSPVSDEDKSSSGSYFMEPLDMKIGLVDEDGDFVIFHYDSRRFTKVNIK